MKNYKDSRVISLIIIGLVYLISIALQVILFKSISIDNLYLKLFIINIIATVLIFIFTCIFKNSIIYKPYWYIEALLLIILLVIHNKINYPVVISFLVVFIIWSLRLIINFVLSFKNLNHIENKENLIKEKTKRFYPFVNFFIFHLLISIVLIIGLIPAIKFITINYTNYSSYIGISIMLLGITLEVISDYDIYIYHKRNKEDRRQIIDSGLWKYSRHPNYLGEIIFFYGMFFAMFAVSSQNWYFIIAPLLVNFMFVFIFVPLSEKSMVKYKFNYEKYQEDTRMLLPFKK